LVPAVAARLPDLRPADAIPRAPLASDASAAVHPDEAADAAIPALAAGPCAEKLAAPAPAVQGQIAKLHLALHPAAAKAPCIQVAGRSGA
jgi:hypothetical protein